MAAASNVNAPESNVMTTRSAVAPPSTAAPKEASSETLLIGLYKMPSQTRSLIYSSCFAVAMAIALPIAYDMRVRSIGVYGYLFHSSDPWFNYRAAEYMSTHGWSAFFSWFDYMSWYPLGRPVGSTTYPGLQLTAVAIHRALAAAGMPMSLNNVCVLMPAWFSLVSSAMAALLAHEMSGNMAVASISSILFSVVPAHLMRSMAGEFDNECIAVAAMLLTFYCWVRSLRTRSSWPIGVLTGVAYGYMAAAWGGYIFVLNMVAMHAGISSMVDWARNTYNPSLLRAYTLFYVVGTAIAVCVPPVGMSPFKSLEQLGALLVLVFIFGQSVCEAQRRRLGIARLSKEGVALLIRIDAAFFVGIVAVATIAPAGFFKPLSLQANAIITGVSRTGNTLVDILLAQDASNLLMVWQLFLFPFLGWVAGMSAFLRELIRNYTYAKSFILMYGVVGMYFASQSVRMMVMMAPVACIFTALLFRWALDYLLGSLFWAEMPPSFDTDAQRGRQQQTAEESEAETKRKEEEYNTMQVKKMSVRMLPFMLLLLLFRLSGFIEDVAAISRKMEAPGIVFPSEQVQGVSEKKVDDYYAGYLYLRDSTPEDARVLAWWDYGYQITGIGNRTSLADGNTWNHEHIATIGKMLTSPVAEAHSLVRHMADYVLISAGDTYFSDLNRSPMMARIGNSVYHDICPDDPLCSQFVLQKRPKAAAAKRSRHVSVDALEEDDTAEHMVYEPSSLIAKSLIYHLHSTGVVTGVTLNETLFQHVFTSPQGLMRIFKVMNVSTESKKWVADSANRVCHPPGSWICPGQYPPAKEIQEMLAHQHTNFKDLLDPRTTWSGSRR
uniref:dolichyl-diphosphooligosaccharide--protein glycotransferase n=2 Tax=Leishmania major TaxID=5664 RepID=Q9U5N8_LEIMA|nr:hypothetical STT3 ortholog [Leishmania major]